MNLKLSLACVVFLTAFAAYLFTSVPAITEDDSGELAGAGATLGTAHPPGYPLYCLLSKAIVTAVPFGNAAYRVNLASSLTIAAAAALVFLISLELAGTMLSAVTAAFAFAFCSSVWAMANTTEVYGITAFIAALMFLIMVRASSAGNRGRTKYYYAVMFLFGLGITAHYTIELLLPGILVWMAANRKNMFDGGWKTALMKGTLWSLAGFSVVLYLYVRAQSNPVFGWEDPKTLDRFWQVIARLRYGTAALAQGGATPLAPVMIARKIAFYSSELAANFTLWGAGLFLIGAYSYLKEKKLGLPLLLFVLVSGPGFVILANTGVDAASKELMTRFFFLSFIFAALVVARGLKFVPRYVAYISLFLPLLLFALNSQPMNHRHEYIYYDYGKNILRTLPPKSLLFADRADEMEFAVGYLLNAQKCRPDIKFIDCNAGATRSVYGNDYYRVWGKPRLALRERVESAMIKEHPGPVYYATFFPDMINIPREKEGVLFRAKPLKTPKRAIDYDELYSFRLPLKPEHLIGRPMELVLSYYNLLGEYCLRENMDEKGECLLNGVSALDDSGKWALSQGFIYQQKGMLEEAMRAYEKQIARGSVTAGTYANMGIICERKGKLEEAVKYCEKAISMTPGELQPHYNLAVIYWKMGAWDRVIDEFNKVLEINPGNPTVERFLQTALLKKKERARINGG